ncbi:MAG: DOMON domain-containing protein [Candidatus Coatesbacteria bacterium]|nr:MAG: DOMON domain-containing protein [Candidatus Coatesbacteria bacterium]
MNKRVLVPTKLVIAAGLAMALAFGACNTADDEPSPTGPPITVDGITLTWQPEGANLHVTVKAPTTGWVAVGFDPTVGMKDANLILGYVAGGTVSTRDDFGTAATAHDADTNLGGTDNVLNPAGKEEAGSTEISFTIPLDSGDAYDRVLVVGRTYKVLLAYGPNGADDFAIKHATRVAANITI